MNAKQRLETFIEYYEKQAEGTIAELKNFIRRAKEAYEDEGLQPGHLKHDLLNGYKKQVENAFNWPNIENKINELIQEDSVSHHIETETWELDNIKDPVAILENQEYTKSQKLDKASEAIAKGFYKQHRPKTLMRDNDKRIYYYENGVYHENGRSKIQEYTCQVLGEKHYQKLRNRVVEKIEARSFIDYEELFDIDPKKLCVENGVLDLENQTLQPHSPDKLHFQKLETPYDPDAEYEALELFFKEILATDKDLELLQEIFGFALYRDYILKKAIIFHGEADNGKSTILNILTDFLGEDNVSGVKLQDLGKRFQKRWLVNKLANVVADLDSEEVKHTGDFKGVTGGDLMQYEVKGGGTYPFRNYAKMIYSANELPVVRNPTQAFFNRWIIMKFPHKFVSPKEYAEASSEEIERRNLKLADPRAEQRLWEEQTMSGVLNWALEGLQRLLENEDFSYSKTRREVMIEWIEKSDTFRAFCMKHLEEDYRSYIVKEDLREAYRLYTNKQNVTYNNDEKHWKETLTTEYGSTTKRITTQDERRRCWYGLKFKREYEADWDTLDEERSQHSLNAETKTQEHTDEEQIRVNENKTDSQPNMKVSELFEKHGNSEGLVSEQDFIERFSEDTLRRMKQDGELYEPRSGFIGRMT